MRGTFKLGLVIGVVSIVASGIPACGGDSESDNGKKTGGTGGKDGGTGATGGYAATGGTTGGGGGTTGGGGGSGGATGGTGGVPNKTCGSESCKGYNIANIVTINPCCAGSAKDKCGVDIDQQIADTIGIKPGCFELNQAGNADPGCPSYTIQQFSYNLPGCCNAAASKCSFLGDLSGFGGPNMGCVDPNNLPATDAGPPKDCVPGQPGDASTEAGTGGSPGDASADAASG